MSENSYPSRKTPRFSCYVKGHKTAFSISIAVGCVIISELFSDQICNETIYYMYISMTAMHCTYKAELKSYLQSLNNTVQV